MIIKEKSLLVAFISSLLIALVMVLTLLGYVLYIELKGEEFRRNYDYSLQRINAKIYSKYIENSALKAGIEKSGPLAGKPIIEGTLTNKGTKNISDLFMKVSFLDRDGAVIYEYSFHPQDPSLGGHSLPQVSLPGILNPHRVIIKPNGSLPFKTVLSDCPREIYAAMAGRSVFAETPLKKWSGELRLEIISINF